MARIKTSKDSSTRTSHTNGSTRSASVSSNDTNVSNESLLNIFSRCVDPRSSLSSVSKLIADRFRDGPILESIKEALKSRGLPGSLKRKVIKELD